MNKIAIITDSNAGITQDEATQLGVTVVPMPFTIDNDDYYEGINLSQDEFYDKLMCDVDIMTSQPSPDSVIETWDKALEDNDQVIYIPMSSGLSGSCQTAYMLAMEDYEDKVFVVDNQRISVTQRQSVMDALALAKAGKDGKAIKEILEKDKFNSSIYIMLDTLKYLKKGGRITPAAAALGELLKLKPVLQIQGEKLDAFAKARTASQGKSIMINAIRSDAEERFGGMSPDNIILMVAHSHNQENAEEFADMLKEEFPGFDIIINPLSLSVACHIGQGSLAVAICKKLTY